MNPVRFIAPGVVTGGVSWYLLTQTSLPALAFAMIIGLVAATAVRLFWADPK